MKAYIINETNSYSERLSGEGPYSLRNEQGRILERSGFKLGTGRFCSIFDWILRDASTNTTIIVTQKPVDLPRRVTINSYTRDEDVHTIIDTPIQYVHELQHLLSFCDIPLEIKI